MGFFGGGVEKGDDEAQGKARLGDWTRGRRRESCLRRKFWNF